MTCKEKLIQDNPVWDDAKVEHRLTWDCPSYHDYLGDPAYCDNGFTIDNCKICWDREYIEQYPTIGEVFEEYTDDGITDEDYSPVEHHGKDKIRKSVDILKDRLKMWDIADERREYINIAIECLEYLLEEN